MTLRYCTRPILGAALLALLIVMPARAQEGRGVGIGQLGYSTNEAFTGDDLTYPRGVNRVDGEMLDTYGITVGVRRSWTDPNGVAQSVQVAQVMQSKFNDFATVVVPVSGAFQRVFRNPFPDKVLDGTNWTPQFDQEDAVDPSIPSDAMVYNQATMWPDFGMGIQVERWAYLFATDEYDDFVILEYRFSNISSELREDVVIGLNAAPHSDAHYPADLWGNYYGATYPNYVNGDMTADSLRLWYAWRADQTTSSPNEDDKGDPDPQWGNFREAQFMGNIVIHADTSPSDETDDPNQPFKAGWSQRDFVANLNEADQTTTYNYLSQPWNTGPAPYAKFVDSDGNEVTPGEGYYRVMRTEAGMVAPKGIDLTQQDPELEQEKNNLMSFGPYDMQPGEDVRIVMAFAGGVIPSRLMIDAGRAYDGGQEARQTFGVVPMPAGLTYNDMHGNPIVQDGNVFAPSGEQIASAGDILTRAQKDDIIDIGQVLAFESAAKAQAVWEASDVRYGEGTFLEEVYGPAAPSIEGTSENDQIRLTWSDITMDSRGGPITGYRIYRGYKRPPSITSPTDTTFVPIADLDASVTEYVDTEVVRGEDYYYYIASVNADGVESSSFQNRTGTSATASDEALAPTRTPSDDWKDAVVVVPNPYHVQASQKYSGRRLNFLNLPPYANIHIFTITGDRVQMLEHDASTGDIDWERQDTFSTMEIVSGVYLYVVEELDGPRGNPTGEKVVGKFVVIK